MNAPENLPGQLKKKLLIVSDNFPPPYKGGSSTVALNHYNLLKDVFDITILTTWECCEGPCKTNHICRFLAPKEVWQNNLNISSIHEKDKELISSLITSIPFSYILNLHMWNICAETICYLSQLDFTQLHRFGDEWVQYHLFDRRKKERNGWMTYNPNKFILQKGIVNSNQLKERYEVLFPSKGFHLLRNFVDTNVFNYKMRNLGPDLRLLYVGRIVEHKGIIILIEIVSLLKDMISHKKVTLTVVGTIQNKIYFNNLRSMVNKLGLENHIVFEGEVKYLLINSILKNHDVLLFPSLPRNDFKTIEGCPNILLEAIAVGIPIVSSNFIGHSEILEHKNNCLITDPDSSSFVNMIKILIEEEGLRQNLIKNGLKRIKSAHSKENYQNVLVDLFVSS